jgi:hypothetical protein
VPMKARASIDPDERSGGMIRRPSPETSFIAPGGKNIPEDFEEGLKKGASRTAAA